MEWAVEGIGSYGHFKEQGLQVGVPDGSEGFHCRRFDYLSPFFVLKWCSRNAEIALATAGKTSVLVELTGVAVLPFSGWID